MTTIFSSNFLFLILIILCFFFFYLRLTSLHQTVKISLFLVIPTLFIIVLNWIFVSKELHHISLMVLRFLGLTWLFNWFLKQMNPDDLAKALWSLHVPYRIAWQVSLAYRFLPMFQDESRRIYEIQISRGIPLDGGLFKKLRYLPSMSIPLLVMTQDKAFLFAEALFARNCNSKTPKTVLNPLKMTKRDWFAFGLVSLFSSFSLFS
jgi:energy-coupling factor transporter transmembrane protein EcfT